jgi:hypothetical protein
VPAMLLPRLDKIERVLRSKGIDVATLASNPKDVERAVDIVHGMIPIPLRWILGKKAAHGMVLKVEQRASGR